MFAGINAALQVKGQGPWLPTRDQAYLGVLVDDLITKGVTEPYRMFTSRAEFRLQLREDNADMRLTEAARDMGLVDDARWDAFNRKRDAVSRETERLKSTWIHPKIVSPAESERVLGKAIDHEYNLFDLLRRPGVTYQGLMSLEAGRFAPVAASPVSRETLGGQLDEVLEQIEIQAKYSGYINRQRDEVDRAAHYESLKLPVELDYMAVTALSIEVRQKLQKHRPETLGQASRISGVTPAAISLLLIHLKKGKFKGFTQDGHGAQGGQQAQEGASTQALPLAASA
jgi:tRNA uridine 5-carboxymethylaminomethyl modification enzyme